MMLGQGLFLLLLASCLQRSTANHRATSLSFKSPPPFLPGYFLMLFCSRNMSLLHKGLELAVEHHQAIVRQGVSMMERKAIVQAGPFRYSIVPETPDLHFFTHPLALSRLALFLVETRVVC